MSNEEDSDETRRDQVQSLRQAAITLFYVFGIVFGAATFLMWIFLGQQFMLDMAIFSLIVLVVGACIDRRRVQRLVTGDESVVDEYRAVVVMGIFLLSVSAVFIQSLMIYEDAYFYVDAYFSYFYAFFVACSLLSAPFALRPTIRMFRDICC